MTRLRPAFRRPDRHSPRVRALLLSLAALVVVAASGCGATLARARISGAEAALAGATRAGAEKISPYEYTAALLYLEKALELEAYARFGGAIEYGTLSEKLAKQAEQKSANADQSLEP